MLPLPFKSKITEKLYNREITKPIIVSLTLLTILLLSATTSDSLSNIDNNQASAQRQIISNNSNIQLPSSNQNFNNSISINSSAASKPIDTLNTTGLIESIIVVGPLSSLPGSQGGGISNNSSSGVNASSSSSSSIAFPPHQSLLFGKWFMNVKKGNVTNFVANFVMFKPEIGGVHNIYNFGGLHTVYNITGFKAEKVHSNINFLLLNSSGMATINGTSNISVNGTTKWAGVHTTIAIDKFLVLRLQFDPKDTDNHFMGQPIYGSVMSLIGPNGTSIVKRSINFDTSSFGGSNSDNTPSQRLKPLQNLFGNR
jgi:hypothetical protein